MNPDLTHIDKMICLGWRGAPGAATARLAPGVSRETSDHERSVAIEDRAMSRRTQINWRHIVRNRIAWNHDAKRWPGQPMRAMSTHAIY